MKRHFYRNFDKITNILGIVFIIVGAILFLYSLRPRALLLIISLLHLVSGFILLKLK